MRRMAGSIVRFLLCAALRPVAAAAETGRDAWLRYAPLDAAAARRITPDIPLAITALGAAAPVLRARDELLRGLQGMLGVRMIEAASRPRGPSLVVATLADVRRLAPDLEVEGSLDAEEFRVHRVGSRGDHVLLVTGGSDRAVLYGACGPTSPAWTSTAACSHRSASTASPSTTSTPIAPFSRLSYFRR